MRIFLGGRAIPRAEFALIGAGSETSGVPVILLLENGEVFTPADYISLGYTNFEVWCVGASGGEGGGVSDRLQFDSSRSLQIMPPDIWAKYVDINPRRHENITGIYDPSYGFPMLVAGTPTSGTWAYNWDEYFSYYNPAHAFDVVTYTNPTFRDEVSIRGGGAGGGGVLVVAGRLVDLAASVNAVVGIAGNNAELGQTLVNGAWIPTPFDIYYINEYKEATAPGTNPNLTAVLLPVAEWLHQYPAPHKAFYPPQTGADGAASSFGSICRASGGKGGHPAKIWDGSAFVLDGDGGDGGAGDRVIPGGGGAGSPNYGVRGTNGIWNPDTGSGQGGGGGHGGERHAGPESIPGAGDAQFISTFGTTSGKGSFSYVDTTIYGVHQDPNYLAPGNGGGVRALRNYPRGSRVPTYDPNGAVILRLTKLV